ncbi:MAG: hypothetical protein ACQESF_03490 [Nanobdellota archaeon]
MPKKCSICGEEASYCIKGTNDYYCKDCAIEHFGDLSMLLKIEEVARKIKTMVEKRSKAPQEEELGIELK